MSYAVYYTDMDGIEMYATDPISGMPFSSTNGYMWKDFNKAKNVKKSFSKNSNILKFTDSVHVKEVADDYFENKKSHDENQCRENYQINEDEETFVQGMKNMMAIIGNLDNEKEKCQKIVSYEDKCICDLEHYLEFNQFNAAEGYKIAKAIADHRSNRRRAKDRVYILETFARECFPNAHFEETEERIEQLKSRCYTPRQLPELFEKAE